MNLITPSMSEILQYTHFKKIRDSYPGEWGGRFAPKYDGKMMARQYFNNSLADSSIVAASITPTTTKTFLFTQAQANQFFPVPFGQNAPFAGQTFRMSTGGLITTPATGTLIIDPVHGNGATTTTGGTDLGASGAQTVTASLSNAMWFLEGYLTYRTISAAATTSTCWFTGAFQSQGTLATAGGGWGMVMGSTAAVSVDTTGTGTAGTWGALNIYITFSVTGGTISSQFSVMQSMN